jgi:hypothetical protein
MQFLAQRRALETYGRRDWGVYRKRKSEIAIIVFGSIIGFAVLIAAMIYAGSYTPHH